VTAVKTSHFAAFCLLVRAASCFGGVADVATIKLRIQPRRCAGVAASLLLTVQPISDALMSREMLNGTYSVREGNLLF
jgi:hypothetical protein